MAKKHGEKSGGTESPTSQVFIEELPPGSSLTKIYQAIRDAIKNCGDPGIDSPKGYHRAPLKVSTEEVFQARALVKGPEGEVYVMKVGADLQDSQRPHTYKLVKEQVGNNSFLQGMEYVIEVSGLNKAANVKVVEELVLKLEQPPFNPLEENDALEREANEGDALLTSERPPFDPLGGNDVSEWDPIPPFKLNVGAEAGVDLEKSPSKKPVSRIAYSHNASAPVFDSQTKKFSHYPNKGWNAVEKSIQSFGNKSDAEIEAIPGYTFKDAPSGQRPRGIVVSETESRTVYLQAPVASEKGMEILRVIANRRPRDVNVNVGVATPTEFQVIDETQKPSKIPRPTGRRK